MGNILLRQEKVMLAVTIGEELLKNGGEVYRVEDTIKRLLHFYGFRYFNVYVLSNGIFVSVDENNLDKYSERPICCVRNVPSWSLNLEKITELNSLSRQICRGKYSVYMAYKRLSDIREMKHESQVVHCLATAAGSASFCFIYGGQLVEMLSAFAIGFVLKILVRALSCNGTSKFISNIFGSILVTFLALSLGETVQLLKDNIVWLNGVGMRTDKVIMGSIMLMMPGVTFVTSIRDFFSGDYLSGSTHLIDAILSGVCVAIGVGLTMKVFILLHIV